MNRKETRERASKNVRKIFDFIAIRPKSKREQEELLRGKKAMRSFFGRR